MIQLANDPNASRSFQRAEANGAAKGAEAAERRVRSGHAWPFLSRVAARPAGKEGSDKPAAHQNGS